MDHCTMDDRRPRTRFIVPCVSSEVFGHWSGRFGGFVGDGEIGGPYSTRNLHRLGQLNTNTFVNWKANNAHRWRAVLRPVIEPRVIQLIRSILTVYRIYTMEAGITIMRPLTSEYL